MISWIDWETVAFQDNTGILTSGLFTGSDCLGHVLGEQASGVDVLNLFPEKWKAELAELYKSATMINNNSEDIICLGRRYGENHLDSGRFGFIASGNFARLFAQGMALSGHECLEINDGSHVPDDIDGVLVLTPAVAAQRSIKDGVIQRNGLGEEVITTLNDVYEAMWDELFMDKRVSS